MPGQQVNLTGASLYCPVDVKGREGLKNGDQAKGAVFDCICVLVLFIIEKHRFGRSLLEHLV